MLFYWQMDREECFEVFIKFVSVIYMFTRRWYVY